MSEISEKLDGILKKINKLLERQILLQEQNVELKGQREKLQEELEQQKQFVSDLENKIKTLQIAKSVDIEEDKTALKQKINEYIREIDKCIALLND